MNLMIAIGRIVDGAVWALEVPFAAQVA